MQLSGVRGLAKPVDTPRSARQAPKAAHTPRWLRAAKAVPDQASAEADLHGFEEARPHELVRVLAQLESDLEAATGQLDTVKATDSDETAAMEAMQAELGAVKAAFEADRAAQNDKERSSAWARSMRLAQQAIEMKRLIAERGVEVADLQRQLAEFEETEKPLPVLAYAGGGVDEEGRERVAQLERQLQLQGRMEPLPVARPAAMPLMRRDQTHKSIKDLLRSAAFPGMVLLAATSTATKACTAAWRAILRRH